ncbi:hypothetical protein Mal64_13670 [Pseudobythopirellula maris]|uniref:PEP-CTERM protein-sorting domain-containing protein n=1 Tax=Pseudobythopirellula maris TaxID=2527991 RepID=A0A5C5ZV92_9BACT|nr:PEP-CTERM sorting domain-containing protein [Pseudobythopirellula maris]TWT90968.1 hypothetical protein Mal64_13670 [Pseudobythopirellula maris]
MLRTPFSLRVLFSGALLALAPLQSAHAGLQSAMTGALTGLPAAETTTVSLSDLIITLPDLPTAPQSQADDPDYQDLKFIDPVLSTKAAAEYRGGPEFDYDPETGGVTVFAPPMLGPADEFGVRTSYYPRTVRIDSAGHLSPAPVFPHLTQYARNLPPSGIVIYFTQAQEPPIDPADDPSYVPLEGAYSSINIGLYDNSVSVSLSSAGSGGAEVVFSRLLAEGLSDSMFGVGIGAPRPGEPWAQQYADPSPEIQVVVEYSQTNFVSPGRYSYGFLATPTFGVPEPGALALLAMAGACFFANRRRSI